MRSRIISNVLLITVGIPSNYVLVQVCRAKKIQMRVEEPWQSRVISLEIIPFDILTKTACLF
jgi:hypothetical protein